MYLNSKFYHFLVIESDLMLCWRFFQEPFGGCPKFLVPQMTIFADKRITLANLSRDQCKTLAEPHVRHFGGIF